MLINLILIIAIVGAILMAYFGMKGTGAIWFIQNAQFVVVCQNLMNGQGKFKEFALIVDSIWFYPIMFFVMIGIIYWYT